MRFTEIINEIRKSEKVSGKKEIKNDFMIDLKKYIDDDNIYISFQKDMTDVTQSSRNNSKYVAGPNDVITPKSRSNLGYKLGLNPKSKFDTPIGIYSYPLKAAWEYYKIGSGGKFPYGTEEPYCYVFKPNKSPLNIQDFTNICWDKIIEMAQDIFTDTEITNIFDEAKEPMDGSDIKVGQIWNIMRYLSKESGISSRRQKNRNRSSDPVLWTKILKKLGVTSIVDKSGTGIIHENEPVQAVFFARDFNVIDVLSNKTKDEDNLDKEEIFNIKAQVLRSKDWSLLDNIKDDYWPEIFTIRGKMNDSLVNEFFMFLLQSKNRDGIQNYFCQFDGFPHKEVYAYLINTKDYEIIDSMKRSEWKYIFEDVSDNTLKYEIMKWFLSKENYTDVFNFIQEVNIDINDPQVISILKAHKINQYYSLFKAIPTQKIEMLQYFNFPNKMVLMVRAIENANIDFVKALMEKVGISMKTLLDYMASTKNESITKLFDITLSYTSKKIFELYTDIDVQHLFFAYCINLQRIPGRDIEFLQQINKLFEKLSYYMEANLPIFDDILATLPYDKLLAMIINLEVYHFAKILNHISEEYLVKMGKNLGKPINSKISNNTSSSGFLIDKITKCFEQHLSIPDILLEAVKKSEYAIDNPKIWPKIFNPQDVNDCNLLLSRIIKIFDSRQSNTITSYLKSFVRGGYFISRKVVSDNIEKLRVNESTAWMELVSQEDQVLSRMVFEQIINVRQMKNYIDNGYQIFSDSLTEKLKQNDDMWKLFDYYDDQPDKWREMIGDDSDVQKMMYLRIMGSNSKASDSVKRKFIGKLHSVGLLTQEMLNHIDPGLIPNLNV